MERLTLAVIISIIIVGLLCFIRGLFLIKRDLSFGLIICLLGFILVFGILIMSTVP